MGGDLDRGVGYHCGDFLDLLVEHSCGAGVDADALTKGREEGGNGTCMLRDWLMQG